MVQRITLGITLAWALLLTGILGGVWWFKSAATLPVNSVPKAAPPVISKATIAPSAPLPEALPVFGTPAFAKMAKERGAAWMAGRNRVAVSLLALWDLTGDEGILQEAAEKFPGILRYIKQP